MEDPLLIFPDAIFVLDHQDKIIGVNRAGEDLLHITHADLLGKPVDVLFPLQSTSAYREEDEEIEPTLIVGSADIKSKRPPAEPAGAVEEENDLPETILLSGGRKSKKSPNVHPQDDLHRTILEQKTVLSPSPRPSHAKKISNEDKINASNDEDFFTETVILKTDKDKDKGSVHE